MENREREIVQRDQEMRAQTPVIQNENFQSIQGNREQGEEAPRMAQESPQNIQGNTEQRAEAPRTLQESPQNIQGNTGQGNTNIVNRKPINPVMRENAAFFLGIAVIYSICFTLTFYRSFIGIMFPLITAATLVVCGLFLKKAKIIWKKSNWWYIGGCLLLGISNFLTTSPFIIFFNTVGILLLVTVFMLRQMYDDKNWNLGQYLSNIMFLYLNMIPEVASPFLHLAELVGKRKRTEKKSKTSTYVLIGVLIGLPMLATVIALLSSADQIFSRVIGDACYKLWTQVLFSPNVFLVILLLILGFFGIYSFLSALTLNNMPEWKRSGKKHNPVIAITFLAMVTVIYIIFCAIQVIFLFTGGLLLPEGYTYAEYAHQGFIQLLIVCLFNLVLVLCCMAMFEVNRVLKLLLFLCCGCTYIMIASSAMRMFLYIDMYHLSFLRVLVLWFLALLMVLMAGVEVTIHKPDFGLFRYCMTAVTIFYLIFSFGKPDVIVAKYNVAQVGQDISLNDLEYLSNLSMDAVPVLSRYDFPHYNCNKNRGSYVEEYDYYAQIGDWLHSGSIIRHTCKRCLLNQKFHRVLERTEQMDIRTFHLSKYLAQRAAKAYFAR